MQRLEFPSGWYADALPSGEYAVLIPNQHVLTHLGPIPFTDADRQPLFIRVSAVGGFRFAGQSWHSTDTVEWHGSWRIIPRTPVGVSPVIYDLGGTLHISDGSIGSQGWRYATSTRLVTGDETYQPTAAAPSLYEWTDLSSSGDTVVVGQGEEGGAWLWDGTQHRELVSGDCRFIRAHRTGNSVAISTWRIGGSTVIIFATLAELGVSVTETPTVVYPPIEPGPIVSGARFRPFSQFFQVYDYPESTPLGNSGLLLRDVMRGFVRPVVEATTASRLVTPTPPAVALPPVKSSETGENDDLTGVVL